MDLREVAEVSISAKPEKPWYAVGSEIDVTYGDKKVGRVRVVSVDEKPGVDEDGNPCIEVTAQTEVIASPETER